MSQRKAIVTTVFTAIAFVAVVAVAIYVVRNLQGNQQPEVADLGQMNLVAAAPVTAEAAATCDQTAATAQRLDPLAVGQLAAFRVVRQPTLLTDLAFTREDGTPVTVGDFAGKTLLLNLWATWCVPCREEMPSLDRLAASMTGQNLQIIPVSMDTTAADRPRAFLDEINVPDLDLYLDPQLNVLDDIKRVGAMGGLPTTIMIDPHGCEIGIIEGPADWSSTDAQNLVTAALE